VVIINFKFLRKIIKINALYLPAVSLYVTSRQMLGLRNSLGAVQLIN